MAEHTPLNEEERADLVAYLDGELDARTARSVEAKLQTDPKARAEADSLRQAWELLDYLPKPEPSAAFTQQTVTRISALRPALTAARLHKRWRPWALGVGWAAALLLAAVGGYAAVRLFPKPQPAPAVEPVEQDPQFVRDLRVIEHYRQYEHVDDVEFLRALDQPDLFGEEGLGF